jgi:ribosomal protein S18 acetylase RimI-like enzyme
METRLGTVGGWAVRFTHTHGWGTATRTPGSGEVYHIHDVYVSYKERGKGLGNKYHEERIKYLEDQGDVTLVTCIVNKKNEAEIKILKKNGWKFLHEFDNKERDQRLILCCRHIGLVEKYDPEQQPFDEDDI